MKIKAVITDWTDWEPTPKLRFVRDGRLQQEFVRLGIGAAGHVAAKEYRWQDVPTIYE